ncbi:MAG: hypothetical protein IKJ80_06435 [Clostridia bacterium]|nr:hypothetical protein [Clostridia bacterium]
MNKMNRIIALILTVVMLIGTLMLEVGAATAVDIIYEEDENGKATDIIDYEKTVAQYLTLEFETPQQKLATMSMMVERDGYQLWVDDFTGEVATVNVATGEILFSNPYDVATTGTTATRAEIMSQIIVTYMDNDAKKEMNSFVDAAQRGQITVKHIKNGVRVEYSIGREDARMLVPRLIEKERFETKILDPFAAEINAVSEDQGLPVLEWRDYHYDLSLRDKIRKESKNQLWHNFNMLRNFYIYHEQGSSGGDQHVSKVIDSMGVYYFETNTNLTQLTKVENLIKTYVPTYTYEDLEADHTKTQYVSADLIPPVFKMALEYTLDKWGVSVCLPANGLRFNESLYQLENISVLPYMGAGANYVGDDKTDVITGYNFFPDGAGTLFRHEDLAGSVATSVSGKVYGQDYAYNTIIGSHQEIIRYPVFGIVSNDAYYNRTYEEQLVEKPVLDEEGNEKKDENGNVITEQVKEMVEVGAERVDQDRGFVAIIEEGDALAELSTYHAGSLSKYNAINMLFSPRPKDTYNLANAISVGANASWTVVSSRKYTGNYTIRYIMLTDDATAKEKGITDYYETTWMGMAEAYRDYLYESGNLDSLTETEVKEDIPVYIQTFGALETIEKYLSIPVNVMTPLTSFEDIKTMHTELAAEGVSNIKFKLTGYANGGMYSSMPSDLDWERAVGGKDGYEELLAYANTNGFELFPDFDFAYVRSMEDSIFDSMVFRKHLVKSINDTYMSKRYYSATRQTYIGRFELAVSPAYYAEFYEELAANLLESYAEGMPTTISIGTLGTELNSDFDEDEPYNREDSKSQTVALFEKIDKDFTSVMTDGANVYTWKYIDHIVNVSLDSSRYIKSSASVPFIGVVLHGSRQFAGTPLNMEGNIGYSFLKAIENGATLNFTLCYQNYDEFKEYIDLSEYYSVRYDILKSEVVEYYKLLNSLTKDLQLSKIVAHEFLIGERVPDEDEKLADEEQAKKEQADKEAAEEEAAEKAYQAAINHGRTVALAEISKALATVTERTQTTKNYSETLRGLLDQLVALESGTTEAPVAPDAPVTDATTPAAEVTDEDAAAAKEKLLKDIDGYLSSIQANNAMLNDAFAIAKKANTNAVLAYEHYVTKNAEGFSQAFKDDVTASYNGVTTAYADIATQVTEAYAAAYAVFEEAKAILGEVSYVLVDPNAEPEKEEAGKTEDDGYKYTKYTDDNDKIVRVEYENGVFFILNFNYFDVTVEYNGQKYTVENSGGIRVNVDGTTTPFAVNK